MPKTERKIGDKKGVDVDCEGTVRIRCDGVFGVSRLRKACCQRSAIFTPLPLLFSSATNVMDGIAMPLTSTSTERRITRAPGCISIPVSRLSTASRDSSDAGGISIAHDTSLCGRRLCLPCFIFNRRQARRIAATWRLAALWLMAAFVSGAARGDRLSVVLNGQRVVDHAQLPGIPAHGPIGLQPHGGFRDGRYRPASSLMHFRNISTKELIPEN